jgi:hypothetical protein
MKATRITLQSALVLLPLALAGCEAATSLRGAGLSDPLRMKSIDQAFEARDNCLVENIHLADVYAGSAQSLAATAAASCQTQTDALISVSNPYGDPRVTAAIQKDSSFRAMGFVLKARGQG